MQTATETNPNGDSNTRSSEADQEIKRLKDQVSSLQSKILKTEQDNANLRKRLQDKDQQLKDMEKIKQELEALKNSGAIPQEEFEQHKADIEKTKSEL